MSRPINAMRPISCCGNLRSRANPHGPRRRASMWRGARAGMSSARQWHGSISVRCLTSMAAALILCSRSARTLDDWYWVAADLEGEQPSPSVVHALSDDLNTPQMIAELHALRNRAASGDELDRKQFAASLRLLGFLSQSADQWNQRKQQASGVDVKQIEGLISERTAARGRKDFKESDRIRDELAAMGIVIKDSKEGTTWEVAR